AEQAPEASPFPQQLRTWLGREMASGNLPSTRHQKQGVLRRFQLLQNAEKLNEDRVDTVEVLSMCQCIMKERPCRRSTPDVAPPPLRCALQGFAPLRRRPGSGAGGEKTAAGARQKGWGK